MGTQCIGKSTFIDDFIKQWPMYKKPSRTYRDFINEQDLNINKEGNEEAQQVILNALVDEVMENKDGEHVIFDRCALDNLVYTLWLSNQGKVSDKFVKSTIDIARESLVFFDIIFFLPITGYSPVNIVADKNREIDPIYRDEIDVLFKTLMGAYEKQSRVFFPIENDLGCPAIIEIFGNPEERIQLAKFYVNDNGNFFGEDESMLTPEDDAEAQLALSREVFSV